MENIQKKLKSSAGESIAETLISLLISALALLMLAGAVSSASNIITESNNTLSKYYHSDSELTPTGTAANITIKGTEGTSVMQIFPVVYGINDTIGNTAVVAYTYKASES